MTVDVSVLDLPEFDPDTTLNGVAFHEAMEGLAATAWLARTPLGVLTLDRDSGEFFLRNHSATFPGQLIAEIYGIADGPLREEIDRNILHLDGDVHRRLRSLVGPFFTPRAADRWRPVMGDYLAELWDDVSSASSCEFVEAFAKPYPSLTIASVMGAPRSDAPRLHDWSNWIQRQFDGPSLAVDRVRIEQAVVEFYEWCDRLLASRGGRPGRGPRLGPSRR